MNTHYTYAPSRLRHKGNLSPIRPRQKMATIYRHRMTIDPRYDPMPYPRDNSFLKKRLNRDIEAEREEMVMKAGRTSVDNPEWMGINFDHYRKSNFSPMRKSSMVEQRQWDVLNNHKSMIGGRNQDSYFSNMIKEGYSDRRQGGMGRSSYMDASFRSTLSNTLQFQPEVTGKVGSLIQRDYTIRRPQLKVGSTDYVDTYSVF